MSAPATFAELGGQDMPGRCRGCGDPLAEAASVRLNLQAQQNKGGSGAVARSGSQTSNWLYRKSVTVCEPCAVRAVKAALDALGEPAER